MTITQAWAGEITKFDKTPQGLMVFGKATGPDLDLDQQIADPKWLRKAMPEWMSFGNVREMHRPSAAGVGKELSAKGDDWNLKALIVDPVAAAKVEAGVYKGFSIGIKDPRTVVDNAAPGGRIVGGTIVEVSLVDRPCNPTARMGIAKAHGATLGPVETAGEVIGKAADDEPAEPLVDDFVGDEDEFDEDAELLADAAAKAAKPTVRDMIDRIDLAAGTVALPDDDLPVFAGLAKGLPATAALSAVLSPSDYRKATATVSAVLAGTLVKRRVDESADIAGAQAVIAQLARLIVSEATELAAGRLDEEGDIACLMDAVRAVKYFMQREQRQDGSEVDDPADALPPVGDMAYVGLAATPGAGATVDPVRAVKAAVPDGVTAPVGPDITKAISDAVAEATKDSRERIKALEADLAKVKALPIPGGPMLMPAQVVKAPSPADTHARRAAEYAAQARVVTDPGVAHAYRSLAARESQAQ